MIITFLLPHLYDCRCIHLFLLCSFLALMAYRMGDFQEAYNCTQKSIAVYPNHTDSKELSSLLQSMFTSM